MILYPIFYSPTPLPATQASPNQTWLQSLESVGFNHWHGPLVGCCHVAEYGPGHMVLYNMAQVIWYLITFSANGAIVFESIISCIDVENFRSLRKTSSLCPLTTMTMIDVDSGQFEIYGMCLLILFCTDGIFQFREFKDPITLTTKARVVVACNSNLRILITLRRQGFQNSRILDKVWRRNCFRRSREAYYTVGPTFFFREAFKKHTK